MFTASLFFVFFISVSNCENVSCFFPCQQSIQFAFNTANVYARTFEPFRLFYKENEELDLEALKEQDHGTSSSSS